MQMNEQDIVLTIKRRRKELGVSQYTLAKDAGISREMIAKFELGKHSPGFNKLYQICKVLGLEIIIRPEAKKGSDSNEKEDDLAAG